MELDLSADIAALRTTFSDIAAVVDLDRLRGEIDALSAEAGAPDLWDDPAKAQQVTSKLSHAQAQLARVGGVAQRLDDLEVLVELANEMDDEATAQEARDELQALRTAIDGLEEQTLLDGEYDAYPASTPPAPAGWTRPTGRRSCCGCTCATASARAGPRR